MLYQLSYTRTPMDLISTSPQKSLLLMVEGEGFEPSYSERTDLQSVAFNHSATPPNRTRDYADNLNYCQIYKRVFVLEFGAGCRNRTDDLRITSALLYQLS